MATNHNYQQDEKDYSDAYYDDYDDAPYTRYSRPPPQYSREKHQTQPKDPTFIKILLFVANVAFLVLGAISMGLGIWTLIGMRSALTIAITVVYGHRFHGQLLISAGAIFVFTSGMLMIASVLGFIVIGKKKNRPFRPYMIMVGASIFLYVSAAALSAAFIGQTNQIFIANSLEKKNEITNYMTNTIKDHYGVNLEDPEYDRITKAWDMVQDEMFCCGVEHNSWAVYYQTQWWHSQGGVEYGNKPYVPQSCCVRDQFEQYRDLQMCQTWMLGPPGQPTGNTPNPAVYYRGCWNSCNEFMKETHYQQASSLMSFGIIISIICGVTLVLMFMFKSRVSPKA